MKFQDQMLLKRKRDFLRIAAGFDRMYGWVAGS